MGQADVVLLAQLNIATMLEPLESERMESFVARLADVNAGAESSPGFVWRLKDDVGPGATSYRLLDDDMTIVNLSVWTDLESLRAFVVGRSNHRAVLAHRRRWFAPPTEAMTACWYVDEGHQPTIDEAERMLLRLRTDGPSAEVFPFTYRD